MSGPARLRLAPLALAAALPMAACVKTPQRAADTTPVSLPPAPSDLSQIPLGNPPGAPIVAATLVRNPLEGDADAVQQGKILYGSMNCVYCHGANGSGLMGPALNSPGWRYGGAPAQLYGSIHDGRPQGMPAWGERLPPRQIWQLVAYLESLGGAQAPATPEMVRLGGPQDSTTGPEPADESQDDTANQRLTRADAARRR